MEDLTDLLVKLRVRSDIGKIVRSTGTFIDYIERVNVKKVKAKD